MSNARNLANLLGTGSTIPTAKIADSAVTAAKLNSTLDLSSKTLTVPSGVSLFKRVYTANITTPQEWVNGFVTISTLSNVVVNSGEQVYLNYQLTSRHKSAGQHHTAYRMDWQQGGTSDFVGQSSWGFGIYDDDSGHHMDIGFLNLSTWPVKPFNQTGTFTFYLKGRSSNTDGYWGAEANGVAQDYEVGQVNVFVG